MSHRLVSCQSAFTRGIRSPEEHGPPAGVDAGRYAVYRDLVYRNLDGLLAGGFPVLRATLPAAHWDGLIREFLARHRAGTPLFLELGREFVQFLGERQTLGWEPGWLWELAHYERIELELDIAPDWHPPPCPDTEPAAAVPRLSPLARVLVYQYPVHRIGPGHDPSAQPSFLLAYRDREEHVQFMALMPATAQLLALVEANRRSSSLDVLHELAGALDASPEQLALHGLEQLQEFVQRGVVYYA